MMFESIIMVTCHPTDHYQFNPGRQEVWNFVGDGMAGSSSIHVEWVSQDQPALWSINGFHEVARSPNWT
jgi:hypothetical protein